MQSTTCVVATIFGSPALRSERASPSSPRADPSVQIVQERRLLEEIDSPFVCNLRFAFQDDENLFMVLEIGRAHV